MSGLIALDSAIAKRTIDAKMKSIGGLVSQLGRAYTIEIRMPETVHVAYSAAARTVYDRRTGRHRSRRTGRFVRPVTIARLFAWLMHGTSKMPARNILVVNQHVRQVAAQAMGRTVATMLERGTIDRFNPQVAFLAAANAIKALYAARFSFNGGDLTLAPLSSRWKRRKAALGFDQSRILVASGQVLKAFRSAPLSIARKS